VQARANLSLADCYALALAKSENALLLTTDAGIVGIGEARTRVLKPKPIQ